MKTQFKFLLSAVILVAILSSWVSAPVKPRAEVVSIQTSAVCESCKNRIEKALKSTDGVISANLNLDDKKIKVKYSPDKISPNQIRTVIANTGYDADGVKKNPDAFTALPKCCQKEGGACEHKK
jgi:periplasmic mercuric ion binding protein